MNPVTWKQISDAVSSVWLAAGPLIGILVAAMLLRSTERKKWLNDGRKQEFKELLTVLTTATGDNDQGTAA